MPVKVCILRIEGTNCEYETFLAFKQLGALPEIVHLKELTGAVKEEGEKKELNNYDLLVIPGGFSAGDYVRAGAILAARIKGALEEEIEEFIAQKKPILGICNGFQVLVEMGLLPGFKKGMQEIALIKNDSNRFECRATLLRHENRGKCIFTRIIEKGQILRMPCAHAEGKFFIEEEKKEAYIKLLEDNDQIVFRYVDPDGNYASYPWNPNGSVYNIAGICNPDGNIFGLMPHPERSFSVYNKNKNNDWRRKLKEKEENLIFSSVIEYLND